MSILNHLLPPIMLSSARCCAEERAEQLSEALVRRHQQAQLRTQRQQMEEEEEEQVGSGSRGWEVGSKGELLRCAVGEGLGLSGWQGSSGLLAPGSCSPASMYV